MKNTWNQWLTLLDDMVKAVIALAFGAMLLAGGLQVFNRYLLANSLSWSEEFQKYMHIWIVFLAIPLGYKQNVHIGMKVFADKLPLRFRLVWAVLINIIWLGLGIVMVYFTLRLMKVAQGQTSPGMQLRMDLVYVGILIGGGYLSVTAIKKLAGHRQEAKSRN